MGQRQEGPEKENERAHGGGRNCIAPAPLLSRRPPPFLNGLIQHLNLVLGEHAYPVGGKEGCHHPLFVLHQLLQID